MKALEDFDLIPDETATVAYTFKEIPKSELEPVELVAKVRRKKGESFLFKDLVSFDSNIILQRQGDNYSYSLERILGAIMFCPIGEDTSLLLENTYQWRKNKSGEKLLVIEAKGILSRVYLIVCPVAKADGEEWI